jgi:hypothetical protein
MKQESCRVTVQGRACGRPAVMLFTLPDHAPVPLCAQHHQAIEARIQAQITEWAAQLAGGASVQDLTTTRERAR